jgi:hypothetical protein
MERGGGEGAGRALRKSATQVGVRRSPAGWSEPAWLAEWARNDPLERPPASAEQIQSALAKLAIWLSPPPLPPTGYLDPLGRLFGWPDDWSEKSPLYDEALEDLPDWALIEAVRSCVTYCRFFPKPAEIRDRLPEQLAQLHTTKVRLETAAWRWRLADHRRRA